MHLRLARPPEKQTSPLTLSPFRHTLTERSFPPPNVCHSVFFSSCSASFHSAMVRCSKLSHVLACRLGRLQPQANVVSWSTLSASSSNNLGPCMSSSSARARTGSNPLPRIVTFLKPLSLPKHSSTRGLCARIKSKGTVGRFLGCVLGLEVNARLKTTVRV